MDFNSQKFAGFVCLFVLVGGLGFFFESMWTLSSQQLSMNNCLHSRASWNVIVLDGAYLYGNRYYMYVCQGIFPYTQLREKEWLL